eukprot:m.142326 g.142326  ORF g.142326 m.142326 type:complete len:158 (+) comp16708_c0_seq12:2282-2755(+)
MNYLPFVGYIPQLHSRLFITSTHHLHPKRIHIYIHIKIYKIWTHAQNLHTHQTHTHKFPTPSHGVVRTRSSNICTAPGCCRSCSVPASSDACPGAALCTATAAAAAVAVAAPALLALSPSAADRIAEAAAAAAAATTKPLPLLLPPLLTEPLPACVQ